MLFFITNRPQPPGGTHRLGIRRSLQAILAEHLLPAFLASGTPSV